MTTTPAPLIVRSIRTEDAVRIHEWASTPIACKVTDPPRPLDYRDAPGIEPKPGDLFSYIPWGNLGFFYTTDGLEFSTDLVRIGTTDDLDQIRQLEGTPVRVTLT